MSAPKETKDQEEMGGYLLCGDPGPWAPLHKLIEYLEELCELPDCWEVVSERSAIRAYIRRRQQRPLPWDEFEQFRDRLAVVMSDN